MLSQWMESLVQSLSVLENKKERLHLFLYLLPIINLVYVLSFPWHLLLLPPSRSSPLQSMISITLICSMISLYSKILSILFNQSINSSTCKVPANSESFIRNHKSPPYPCRSRGCLYSRIWDCWGQHGIAIHVEEINHSIRFSM